MSQLKDQIMALDESLGDFKADVLAQWRIGQMANALLAQAREAAPQDPVIKVVEDFRTSGDKTWVEGARVGTIRATLRQVAEALPPDDAAPMVVKRNQR